MDDDIFRNATIIQSLGEGNPSEIIEHVIYHLSRRNRRPPSMIIMEEGFEEEGSKTTTTTTKTKKKKTTTRTKETTITPSTDDLLSSSFTSTTDIPDDEEELHHLAEAEQGLLSWKQPHLPEDYQFWQHLDEEYTEQLLTEEMERLSLTERESIVFDVHGITPLTDRKGGDPPDVDQRLEEMDANIDTIRRKHAYERAKYMDETYVQDRSFRLRFLRCDRFQSALAAQRMVRHFRIKQALFGDGPVLARDVLQSDLSPLDIVALKSGYIQTLPARDTAGRSIVFIAPNHRPATCSLENCVSTPHLLLS